MRRSGWLLCVVMTLSLGLAFAGDVQVLCEPGLRVYLDDGFVGVSTGREDGLVLVDLPEGEHTIRLEKDGHLSQVFRVEVMELPVEVEVTEPFVPVPSPRANPPGEAAPWITPTPTPEPVAMVGRLVVTSAPQNCTVEFDGETIAKDRPHLDLGGLAPGTHTIIFRKEGFEPVTGEVTIHPGAEIRVRGNLKEGRLDTVHEGMGALRLVTKPSTCTVRFRGEVRRKARARMNMTHIPAGSYTLEVAIPGRSMRHEVVILDGRRAVVEVSFLPSDPPFVVTYEPT